jgi:hypothetical protein
VDRYEIVVIGPRDAWSASRASTGGTVRAVVFGDRAWVDRGTGAFVPTSIATAEAVVGFDAANGLLATYRDPELANALRFVGREEHDGAPADHYRATTDALRAIRPNVGQTATVDVWIAPDGNLVAISSVGWPSSDDELQVVVSAVDDPANVIRPPG